MPTLSRRALLRMAAAGPLPLLTGATPPPKRLSYMAAYRYRAGEHLNLGPLGLSDVIFMLPDAGQFLYEDLPRDLEETFRKMRRAAGGLRVQVSFYCFDTRHLRPEPKRAQAVHLPEPEWSRFLTNLRGFAKAAAAAGIHGVLMDSEHYGATPNYSGGLMEKGQAWVAGAEVPRRGEEYAAALAPLEIGTYVYFGDAVRHAGFAQFWKAATTAYQTRSRAPADLLLEDSYLAKSVSLAALAGRVRQATGMRAAGGVWLDPTGAGKPEDRWPAALRESYVNTPGGVWIYDHHDVLARSPAAPEALRKALEAARA